MDKNNLMGAYLLGVIVFLAVATYSSGEGTEVTKILKKDAVCRVIGVDVDTNEPVVSCFWGTRIDASKDTETGEITNLIINAFEEIYLGGTFSDGVYNYDGYKVGKYRKDFKYNDHSDVFWKVEVGLNGSTLEYCTMRDQEYSDTSRTKERCQSLYIDIM